MPIESDLGPFAGFGPDMVAFWRDLEANNSKIWFDGHRDVYEDQVRRPMEQLLADVADEFGDHAKVFRPNRDIRFSRDKTPYKVHCGAVVSDGTPASPIYYAQVSADGLVAGSGYHHMSRDQVQRYLAAVDDDATGPELEALVATARDAGASIGGSELKTSPRGYANDHPRVALLRHKGVTLTRSWAPFKWLQTREALRRVTDVWRETEPINTWLATNVGAAREPRSSRP